jgi:hypothetical protein
MFTRFIPFRVCGLNFMSIMVRASVVVNRALVTITIKWGIATKYNDTNLTSSMLKLEILA